MDGHYRKFCSNNSHDEMSSNDFNDSVVDSKHESNTPVTQSETD